MASAQPPTLKWDQPPQPGRPDNVFYGWNELSVLRGPQIAADDWVCTSDLPITSIRWWGSYPGWKSAEPPPDLPALYHFAIWTDVPMPNPDGFSHPGVVIWEYTASAPAPTFTGWDYNPITLDFEACFVYEVQIDPASWFYQEPTGAGVYWLSIAAFYPAGSVPHGWGWKTRPRDPNSPAPDDAVVIWSPTDPHPGMVYQAGAPLFFPMPEDSFDLTFELTSQGDPPVVKWSQPPANWVPPDAFNGWNEVSVLGGPQLVADDWVCTTARPVTDLHWWGSFLNWGEREPPPDRPSHFRVSIWTDVPAGVDQPWSHPGVVIHAFDCPDFRYEFAGWDFDPRDPTRPPEACFRFEQDIAPESWFFQEPGANVYWISIAAVYPYGQTVEHLYGWKTRPRLDAQSPDDAVVVFDPLYPDVGVPFLAGGPLWWPTPDDSWDVAFQLTTSAVEEPLNDLGDAPDSTNGAGGWMTAYPKGGPPGVVASYPTVYLAGSPPFGPIHRQPLAIAYLGPAVTLENEADTGPDQDPTNNLIPPMDAPDLDLADDAQTGDLAAPTLVLPHCQPAAFNYRVTIASPGPTPPLYVNVWFDWNRDGDWNDVLDCGDAPAPEWAVQNQLLPSLPVGMHTITTPPFLPWHPPPTSAEGPPVWMRITLSEQMWDPAAVGGDGGSGPPEGYEFGETEDYYVTPSVQEPKWRQYPHGPGDGFDAASDLWWPPGQPGDVNRVVADDFLSDGRPIKGLRWWGSYLDERFQPDYSDPIHRVDGWLISFHAADPATAPCPPEAVVGMPTAVGVYFAPVGAVTTIGLGDYMDCFDHPVYEYRVDLSQCCLLCWEVDPRTGDVPAQPEAFRETVGLMYWLDIQAVTGVEWLPPVCEMSFTGHQPSDLPGNDGHFWGWHTSPADWPGYPAMEEACAGQILEFGAPVPECWLYGAWEKQPWLCPVMPPNPPVHMAFELLTDASECPCPGDLTEDGFVNGDDIQCFVDCIIQGVSSTCDSCLCGDMDGDLDIDTVDQVLFVGRLLYLPTNCP